MLIHLLVLESSACIVICHYNIKYWLPSIKSLQQDPILPVAETTCPPRWRPQWGPSRDPVHWPHFSSSNRCPSQSPGQTAGDRSGSGPEVHLSSWDSCYCCRHSLSIEIMRVATRMYICGTAWQCLVFMSMVEGYMCWVGFRHQYSCFFQMKSCIFYLSFLLSLGMCQSLPYKCKMCTKEITMHWTTMKSHTEQQENHHALNIKQVTIHWTTNKSSCIEHQASHYTLNNKQITIHWISSQSRYIEQQIY